jgi:hypothetical protein
MLTRLFFRSDVGRHSERKNLMAMKKTTDVGNRKYVLVLLFTDI